MAESRGRSVRAVVAAGAAAIAFLTLLPAGAQADPVVPGDAPPAVREVGDLSHRAEVLTEEWHVATDQLARRRAEVDQAEAAAAVARVAADRARGARAAVQGDVDVLTDSVFRGARFDEFSAFFASDSPDDLLDRMSALDVLGGDRDRALRELGGAVARTEGAENAAGDAATQAALAELEATRVLGEIDRARAEMDRQIALVQLRLDGLTEQERAQYTAGGITDFPISAVPGDGVAVAALRAALTRQGAPYVWGATGPGTFDCSGLLQWAYQQVGVQIPRPSREQARAGRAVAANDLRVGDLVALNSPVSHIGIYVGEGRYLNAPQSGDVVKVAQVPWNSVTAVRRIG